RQVADAYVGGLEDRVKKGQDVSHIASVASFFISRVDTAVDQLVAERLNASPDAKTTKQLESVRRQVAIANAKQAHQLSEELFGSPRWQALEKAGARPQRLLWASTGVKDPGSRDTRYVEE